MKDDYHNWPKRFVDEGYIGETWYEFINRVIKPEIEKKVKLATLKEIKMKPKRFIDYGKGKCCKRCGSNYGIYVGKYGSIKCFDCYLEELLGDSE